jgi:putative ATP-binding cassette transporter
VNLLKFFAKESTAPKRVILIMAAISGIANGLLLGIINKAAEIASDQEVELYYFVLFVIAFILFLWTKRYALSQAIVAVEDVLCQVRIRISDKIRKSELRFIEDIGRARLYTQLTQDTNLISQSAQVITNAAQAAIVLVACMLYIAWLSPVGFCITVASIGSAVALYLSSSSKMSQALRQVTQREAEYVDGLAHILDGFKEIKLNQRKNDDVFAHVETISSTTRDLKVDTGLQYIGNFMFSQVFYYLLLAVIIFLLPRFSSAQGDVIVQITTAILFIIGPLDMLVSAVPLFARANVAIENITHLEAELDEGLQDSPLTTAVHGPGSLHPFSQIQFDRILFHYVDDEGLPSFSVGPIDFTVQQGEILFVIGGNGSGKSTLLKLLTGLYYPNSGTIAVDSRPISREFYPYYRELFSVIFTDFHLFDRLYGLDEVDDMRLYELLRELELDHKTEYRDRHFTHLNLSTGQRKRLAFITSLLDDKPMYVFDELAADQDPVFRRHFYEVLLKELKQQGKTIIAVTHDDHYFHVADRVLKMEYGRLAEEA